MGLAYVLERNELSAAAGYACLPSSRARIEVGDGILGQAVATGQIKELKSIDRDNLSISFALGEANPSHIVALPVFDRAMPAGAIELGSLQPYSPLA